MFRGKGNVGLKLRTEARERSERTSDDMVGHKEKVSREKTEESEF